MEKPVSSFENEVSFWSLIFSISMAIVGSTIFAGTIAWFLCSYLAGSDLSIVSAAKVALAGAILNLAGFTAFGLVASANSDGAKSALNALLGVVSFFVWGTVILSLVFITEYGRELGAMLLENVCK